MIGQTVFPLLITRILMNQMEKWMRIRFVPYGYGVQCLLRLAYCVYEQVIAAVEWSGQVVVFMLGCLSIFVL